MEGIEAVFTNEPWVYINEKHASDEDRYSAVDIKEKRKVFSWYSLRENDGQLLIQPISARYMRKKEKDIMKDKKELKKIPVFKTDKDAEKLVEEVDLTEYDISGFKPVKFEFKKKTEQMIKTLAEKKVCHIPGSSGKFLKDI